MGRTNDEVQVEVVDAELAERVVERRLDCRPGASALRSELEGMAEWAHQGQAGATCSTAWT